MRLGSRVAVVQAGSCGSDSTHSLGKLPYPSGTALKSKKKKKKKKGGGGLVDYNKKKTNSEYM